MPGTRSRSPAADVINREVQVHRRGKEPCPAAEDEMNESERNGQERAAGAEPPRGTPFGPVERGTPDVPGGDMRLRPRVIERAAIIRLAEMTTILEEDDARTVKDQLVGLVRGHGHTRLIINFDGVRYAS